MSKAKRSVAADLVLLKHHLGALRLPSIKAECEQMARQAAADNLDYLGFLPYGSLVFKGGLGNPEASNSYKSGGKFQSRRRRLWRSVKGDSRAKVWPLTRMTLMLMVFITASNNSALGRAVLRLG